MESRTARSNCQLRRLQQTTPPGFRHAAQQGRFGFYRSALDDNKALTPRFAGSSSLRLRPSELLVMRRFSFDEWPPQVEVFSVRLFVRAIALWFTCNDHWTLCEHTSAVPSQLTTSCRRHTKNSMRCRQPGPLAPTLTRQGQTGSCCGTPRRNACMLQRNPGNAAHDAARTRRRTLRR